VWPGRVRAFQEEVQSSSSSSADDTSSVQNDSTWSFAAGLTPAYLVAWYLMHVLVVLVEKGGLFARQRVVYFVIGMRVGSSCFAFLLSFHLPAFISAG